jgi:glycosyltransferase involved in cell wall biosynthesis
MLTSRPSFSGFARAKASLLPMRIAVAQDWMVNYAGSERVVEEILRACPDSDLLTTLFESKLLPPPLRKAKPSFLQRIPSATKYHEWLLPLMPLAWALREPVRDVDAVVSSSHACAKAVRFASGIPHLCYCHTPMRYAWDFDLESQRFPIAVRPAARLMMAWFRRWDRGTAARVDVFVANSTAVAERIARSYDRPSRVIHPPVDTDRFTPGGERTEAFLYVGRLVGYKRPDLVVDAFAEMKHRLVMVGEGHLLPHLRARAIPNVTFLGHVDQETLLRLYRTSRALVFPAEEDFGIAMAEAQACGTPVIALNRGGARDIVEHGVTGWLLDSPTVDAVQRGVRQAAREELDPAEIRRRAERFSASRFREQITLAIARLIEAAQTPDGLRRLRRAGLD